MAVNSGTMIADRYRLQRLIATGGMGQVWDGLDTRLDRRVAVKILKAELSDDPDFLTRFRFEARTTAQLNHPGIAGGCSITARSTTPKASPSPTW